MIAYALILFTCLGSSCERSQVINELTAADCRIMATMLANHPPLTQLKLVGAAVHPRCVREIHI